VYYLTITKLTSLGHNFHHRKTSTPTSFTPRCYILQGNYQKIGGTLIHEQNQVSKPYSY